MKKALAFSICLPTLAAFGAYNQNVVIPYITFVAIASVIVLGTLRKLKYLPLYLLGMSLAIIWQNSMLGSYIVGVDNHGELYVVTQAIRNGWDTVWANSSNTSWVLGFLAPLIARVGLDPIWQFKLLYPAVFAVTPTILFYTYRSFLDERRAFLASTFLFIMPMFSMEMTSIIKSMIAQTFLAFTLLLLLWHGSMKYKLPLLIVSIVGAITSHYTVGVVVVIYLCGALLVLLALRHIKPYVFVSATTAVVVLILWFGWIGSGSMLSTLITYTQGMTRVITDGQNYTNSSEPTTISTPTPYVLTPTLNTPNPVLDTTPTTNTPSVPSASTFEYNGDAYRQGVMERTQPVKVTKSYLDNQEPLVRAALGIDFLESSTWGKVFRVFQFLTQLAILYGFVVIWKKRKGVPPEYFALSIVALALLAVCVFAPFFTTIVSATRFYQITLLVLAPLFVLGSELVWKKRALLITSLILLLYFAFTSGFIFEITKSNTLNTIDTPYSFAFSNYRKNIVGTFNDDDIRCARWVAESTSVRPMYTDYQGYTLMQSINEGYGINGISDDTKPPYYLFLNTWNTTRKELVFGRNGGLRYYKPLPNLKCVNEVFRSGGAVVYEVRDN